MVNIFGFAIRSLLQLPNSAIVAQKHLWTMRKGCGCVPIKRYSWTWKFEFHVILMSQNIPLNFLNLYLKV